MLTARFNINMNGEAASLGAESNTPEAEEFLYYNYFDQYPNSEENRLGLKEGKYKTMSSIDIEEPAKNSELNEQVVYYIPPREDFASLVAFNPRGGEFGGGEYALEPVSLGRNVFTDTWEWGDYSWGFGFPWELDYRYRNGYDGYQNNLGLQKGVIDFDNKQFDIHEALVFGTNTPRVETSLTKGDDSYQDIAYVEIEPAYKDGYAYNNDGFKYIYAFDEPIDLERASEDNPLTITFLGRCLEIVGVPSYNQIITRPCGCKAEKHIGCEFNVCKEVDGPGADECGTNADCQNWPPPRMGSRCINNTGGPMCWQDYGIEGYNCTADADCTGGDSGGRGN